MKNKSTAFYKSKTTYAVKWNTLLTFSGAFISFVIGIVLARLLDPSDFGLLAMVVVFRTFGSQFVTAGTGAGIIQKKEVSQKDLSTVFFYNIVIGMAVSVVLFLLAGPIARFYEEARLYNIVRAIAWIPFISSFSIVQANMMLRNIDFKKKIIAQLCAQLFSGAIGVSLAFQGYGVWALVFSSLSLSLASSILYWIQGQWVPSLVFSKKSFRNIWGYSSKILYGNLIGQAVQKLDILIIGKILSPAILGLYQKGRNLSHLPARQLGTIFTKSYFPILSRLQDEPESYRTYYLQQCIRILWISVPLFTLLSLISHDLIVLLYGKNWAGAAHFFAIACFAGLLYTNNAFMVNALNSLGKSNITLKISSISGPVRILIYLLPLFFFKDISPLYFLWVIIAFGLINYILFTYIICNLISLSITAIVKKGIFIFLGALLGYLLLHFIDLELSNLFNIIAKTSLFVLLYMSILSLGKDRLLFQFIHFFKRKIKGFNSVIT